MYKFLLFLGFVFFSVSCAQKNSFETNNTNGNITNEFDTINNWTTQLLKHYFINLAQTTRFNGGIIVSKNGSIVYQDVSGYANYAGKDTLTLHTAFQIGSVSKQFTAVAILQLFEKGLLQLSDAIEKYIPGFPDKSITINMLLNHTSGLANYNYFCEQYTDRITPLTNKEVADIMIAHNPAPYFPPGLQFDYCNTNYVLLALIVENVSKMPFRSYCDEHIFKPSGMTNTYIFSFFNKRKAAIGYHFPWTEALHTYQDEVTGDKGVYTTLYDMYNWDRALYSGEIISHNLLNTAFQPSVINGEVVNYGMGWRIMEYNKNSKIIFHGGWWRGFTALFVRDLTNKTSIFIYSNVRTNAVYNNYQFVLNVLSGKPIRYNINSTELAR